MLLSPRSDGKHLSNNEIAQRLGIPTSKVKTLIHQACIKLKAHNRNEATFFATIRGEITFSELYSLDELAELSRALGPDVLRMIAHLVRQALEHGQLPGEDNELSLRTEDKILY